MDGQGDDGWLGPKTAATVVVPSSDPLTMPVSGLVDAPGRQGQLFGDVFATFADTDQIPAVAADRRARRDRHHRTPGWLRAAVAVVALAVVAAAVVLGLAQAGVIGHHHSSATTASPSSTATTGHGSSDAGSRARHTGGAHGPALATQTSTGSGTATYAVAAAAYKVTVTTTTGRCWVSIGAPGHAPSFSGILAPASTQSVDIYGPAAVEVGAGGTRVTLDAAGHRSTTLTPPAAPFNYQLVPAH